MAFLTIRKNTVIAILSVVLAVVIIAATAATVIVSTRADNGITIVIDPGHGGVDGGVTGATTGTKESDINLAISKRLASYLKQNGYNAVLTRSDSGAVSGGLKYSKREDMRARRDIVEAQAPDLVVSVHCNSYPLSSVCGAQTFFIGDGKAKTIAETVQNYFNDILNIKPRNAAVGDYYILNCTSYPSILCECGFLSNADEENKLMTASYQEKVAFTIYSAINSVFYDKA